MKLELVTQKNNRNLSEAVEEVLRIWTKGVLEIRYPTFVSYREYDISKDNEASEIYSISESFIKRPRIGTRVTICKGSGEGLLSPFTLTPYKGPRSITIEYSSETTLTLEWGESSSDIDEVVSAVEKSVRRNFATEETRKHIAQVQENLNIITLELDRRGRKHDASKLEPPEEDLFCENTAKLRELTYGSPEYQEALRDLGPALEHHYKMNPHHPEHWGDLGVRGMSLLDLIEMLADWYAATKRHADGDLRKSIEINKNRFNMGDDLTNLLTITAERLGWIK